jgi:luciferase family oxidoreductase group 1
MTRLSVIDVSSPAYMPQLVQHAEICGYSRFWATEHHSAHLSASPTLVAALAAAMTERIRIGTAGVLLHYACPAKIAEDFRLLELYFPGRIDLGIAGGRLSAHESLYLDGRPSPTEDHYGARVRMLVELMRGSHELTVGPSTETQPPLWLCGKTRRSAVLAGAAGLNFAFHHFFARSTAAAREAVMAYREAYRGIGGTTPYAMLACYGACGRTEDAAARHWSAYGTETACFLGTSARCVDQLSRLAEECVVDEIAVSVHSEDFDARLDGYANLAEAAGLSCRQRSA